jgi:cytochrome c556
MRRLLIQAGLPAAGLLGVVALALAADGERTPSIRAVMHKQYRVTRAPFKLIQQELDLAAPDWEKVAEAAHDFVALAAYLEKNEPKWGDMTSWKEFTALHMKTAKELEDAAAQHDRAALRAAHRRIETACDACHDAHRKPRRE